MMSFEILIPITTTTITNTTTADSTFAAISTMAIYLKDEKYKDTNMWLDQYVVGPICGWTNMWLETIYDLGGDIGTSIAIL